MNSNSMTEDSVREYLLANSDFFCKNSDLISNLNFSHENIGSSTSLLVKQNSVLRKELNNLKKKMNSLSVNAAESEKIYLELIKWFQGILCTKSRNRITYFIRSITTRFKIQLGSVVLLDDAFLIGTHVPNQFKCEDELLKRKIKALSTSLVINSKRGYSDWLKGLANNLVLGDIKLLKEVCSVAVVPVSFSKSDKVYGALIFAASNENRFSPSLGTIFLDSFGCIFASFIFREAKK